MQKQSGYIAIVTVIMIVAVLGIIVTTVALLAINESQEGLGLTQGEGALRLAEDCTENAIEKIRSNASYTGETMTLPEGSCTITATSVGNTWTLQASGTDGNYTRNIKAVATKGSIISITSWTEQ